MPTFLRRFDSTVPVTALLVIAMFVAGITAALGRNSAGDKTAAQVQSGSPTPAAAAPVAPVDAAADQRLAQSLVLDRNDLPDGWEVAPHQTDSADAQSEREEAVCLGLPDPAATKSAEMYGPDGTANVSQISTAALVTRTEQQASAYVTAEAGPKSSACAKEGLTKAFARGGITVRDIGVGRFTVSTGNVRNVAIHTELAVSRGGQAGVIYADVVFMQQRRVVGQALFISSGSPFPNDVEQTIVTRFAHKIANV